MLKTHYRKQKSEITHFHAREIRGGVSKRMSESSLEGTYLAGFGFALYKQIERSTFFEVFLPRRKVWSDFRRPSGGAGGVFYVSFVYKPRVGTAMSEADFQTPPLLL